MKIDAEKMDRKHCGLIVKGIILKVGFNRRREETTAADLQSESMFAVQLIAELRRRFFLYHQQSAVLEM